MHYFQFHIGDYKSHTHHLSLIEDLAYRRLLDHYYLHEIPIKQREIARQIGMRDYEQEVLTVLNEFFVSTEAGFINPRADDEILKYKEFSSAGKRGAAKRWSKGGDSPPITLPNATPIATTTHYPLATTQKKEATSVAVCLPDWMPLDSWEEFLKMRKRIKKPPTDYAIKLLISKLEKFKEQGQNVKDVLDRSITSSWMDLYEITTRPVQQNKWDVATVTAPAPPNQDAALKKIEADSKKAAPMPDSIRELANKLRSST